MRHPVPANLVITDGGNSVKRYHDQCFTAAFARSMLAFRSDGIPEVDLAYVQAQYTNLCLANRISQRVIASPDRPPIILLRIEILKRLELQITSAFV